MVPGLILSPVIVLTWWGGVGSGQGGFCCDYL